MKTSRDYRPLLAGLLIATIGLVLLLGWLAFGPGSRPVASGRGPVVAGSVAGAAFANEITFNAGAGNTIVLTLQDNVTRSQIANPTPGQSLTFVICQDSTGSHTMTWPDNLKLSGGAIPLTAEGGKCDSLTVVYDGNYWWETARSLNE
jgi:hypothetical protein